MRFLLAAALAAAIHVPSGYRVETWATGLEHPTALSFGPDHRLYVSEDVGKVVSVSRGTARPRPFASGLTVPLGLLWRGQTLYVSESGRVQTLTLAGRRRTIVSGLPFGLHQQDAIVAGPDGRLYLGSGSTCDSCKETDRRSAAILSFRPDGSHLRVVAQRAAQPLRARIRRPHPVRDGQRQGQARRQRAGRDGRPGRGRRQLRLAGLLAELRARTADRGVLRRSRPVAYLDPHSSADGIASWRGDLFVAEWGEYLHHNHGRRLVRISRGHVTTFATGFDHPLALAVDPSGGLLVADWGRGVIYEIRKR